MAKLMKLNADRHQKITDKAADVLHALPLSPEEIAETLEKEGIVGEPHNELSCPIAQYVCKKVRGVTEVRVHFLATTVSTARGSHQVFTPPQVSGFMEAFDTRKFKRLIVSKKNGVSVVPDAPAKVSRPKKTAKAKK
jgi:hypothetical protein